MALQEERQKLINEQHMKNSRKTNSEDSIDEKLLKKASSDEKFRQQNQDQRFQSLS